MNRVSSICIGFLILASMSSPKPGLASEIDPSTVPISKSELRVDLVRARTQTDYFVLINRANRYGLQEDAISTLKEKQKHKENQNDPVLLSALCEALLFSHDPAEVSEHTEYLNKAYAAGKDLWMPNMLKGFHEVFYGSPQRGLELLRRAARIGKNVSIPHYYLGVGYLSTYSHGTSPNPLKCLSELNTADRLEPRIADIALMKLSIYGAYIPSKAKAKLTKEEFMSELAPGTPLNSIEKAALARVAPDGSYIFHSPAGKSERNTTF